MSNQNEPIRIPLEEAKDRYDENQVTVLDVVDPGTFEKLSYKIEDAVRIDPRDISDEFEQLPEEQPVLTYCT